MRSLALALVSLITMSVAVAGEVEVVFDSGEALLAGTLALPDSPAPVTAVVLISGSGPSDRNESLPVTDFQPFREISDFLSANGIAVLRYDDRGVGESSGDFLSATSEDFAEDAAAAVAYLRTRPEIASDAIGVLGHSEGGMIAPMVARQNLGIAFVVVMAPTTVPGYEILSGQLRDGLSGMGLSPEDQELAYQSEIGSLDLNRAADWPAVEASLRGDFAAMPEEAQRAAGGEEEFLRQGMTYHQGWLHYFITHDPAEDWREVDVPVLALFGERDVQVRSALNVPPLQASLASNEDVTIVRLPTANHLFQDSVTGEVKEYGDLASRFAEGFLETLRGWIASR